MLKYARARARIDDAAEKYGWLIDEAETDHLVITRSGERLEIRWRDRRVVEAPTYTLLGYEKGLSSTSNLVRVMERTGPSQSELRKAYRKKPVVEDGEFDPGNFERNLPFDPEDADEDHVKKATMGSGLVWMNEVSGQAEQEYVPKVRNQGSEHFYVSRSRGGEPYLSFLNGDGKFRAVSLVRLLRIN